jgi:hypothetical protein
MASFIDSGKSLTGKSGSKTKLDGSGQGIGKNDIAGLLPDHVDRGDDEETGDAGEQGGIDDTEILGAIDAEVAIHDGHRI